MARNRFFPVGAFACAACGLLALSYSMATYGKGWGGYFGFGCFWAAWILPVIGAILGLAGVFGERGGRWLSFFALLLNVSWMAFMVIMFRTPWPPA